MNPTQKAYLQGLAHSAFEAQGGYLGGIEQQAQLDTAVRMAAKAIASKALLSRPTSPRDAIGRAVAHVRSGRMRVAPGARTVALCPCGKPKAAHSAAYHQP